MADRFDFHTIVPKFDAILSRGLCSGIGDREGQMCIEAAICAVLDLPHGDNPECVAASVRSFKISLNDAQWSSPEARAQGLRELGIAQIGSRGVVSDHQFITRLTEKIIRELIPVLFRRGAPRFDEPHKSALLKAADGCAAEGTAAWAAEAARAARAAWAAGAAWAARAARAARAAEAARAARAARAAEADPDYYLRFVANLALQVLIDLESPGAMWLEAEKESRS